MEKKIIFRGQTNQLIEKRMVIQLSCGFEYSSRDFIWGNPGSQLEGDKGFAETGEKKDFGQQRRILTEAVG